MAETINNSESSSSTTKNKGKGKQIEDLEIDYGTQSDENLSATQLREQVTECLESITNNNNRRHHFIRLHTLLLTTKDRLDNDQLENVLTVVGTANILYKTHTVTTSMELELHLRTYVLALEAWGRRPLIMTKEFRESLYRHLAVLNDFHQRHAEALKNGLNKNIKSEYNPYIEQRTAYDLYSNLENGVKCQNYNIDFLLIHLRDTLHAMHDDETVLFKIIKALQATFTSLVGILPGMANIMANIQTPFDNNTSLETYNNIQQALSPKFPISYWYKDWRYLYSTYQAFVEWSAIPINENLVFKGELMIIKDLWRFGDQEWAKAATKSESKVDTFRSNLKHTLVHIGGYAPVSYPYSLLYGILEITQKLILSTKNTSTLAHCYYIAKLTLDIVPTENIQFKAMEVLMTLYNKEPDTINNTFSVVKVDLSQHIDHLAELDGTNANSDSNRKRLQDAIEYINMNYKFTRPVLTSETSMSKQKAVLEQNPEELLDSNPNDLLILDMVADHLTCPFTQRVTDDFRILPCAHKISYSALEKFMKLNYHSLKCFYCNQKVKIQDTELLESSPIYKALYEKFVETGHITPKDKTNNFTAAVENQEDSESEEYSIMKTKFLYLLKMKPKKTLFQRIRRPKGQHPAYRQGKKALNDGRYRDAITWLERALEHYPNSSTIQCDLAYAYYQCSNYQKCYDYTNETIKNNPKNARAWAILGANYGDQSEYRQSLKSFKQSLEIDPNNALALRGRGEVYRILKQYDDALVDLNKSLEIDSNDAVALRRRGEVYRILKQYDNALIDLNKSLEIEPNSAFALRGRGYVYQMLEQYDNALVDLNKSLEIEPNSASALRERGEVYRMLEQYDNALIDLNKSLEIKPNSAFALEVRGEVYRMLEQYDNALVDLNKSLEIDPNNAVLLRRRGEVYRMLEQYDNALIDLNKSLEIEPNSVFALRERGYVYHMLEQYDNALVDYKRLNQIMHLH